MSVSTKGTNLSSTTFTQGTTVLSNLAAEDPFCWANSRGYHMLLHMFDCNSLYMHVGLHAWSIDGIQWNASKTPAYNGSVVFADNNQTVNFSRRERPFLVFAKDRPLALVNSAQRNFFWVSGCQSIAQSAQAEFVCMPQWDKPPHCGQHQITKNSTCSASTIITRVVP